ncbi:uncharacterized protein LOC116289363 isoform X2 [Actinia tenebrosa]|uniref:Uncharacterized protein LOC116289363 isoform X2 n=1 Tax=Actinia tenebrosa TaxID=6105 RepID=A0A6P8H9B2_ACTTE|nr:uncharacterized protein LOC116289363 isoform X2 [Actinia tenebrosa]
MECKTVSMTLDDLMTETDRRANQKLKEIHYFDTRNHAHGLKPSDDRENKVLSNELENRKQEVTNLKEEFLDLTNRIEELKGKKEALSKTFDERETRLDSLEEAVEQNKINQEKEKKEFNENHAKNMKKSDVVFEREIDEADRNFKKEITEIYQKNKRVNQKITTPTKENLDINYCQAYIGRVCLILQAIMYHIVLPDQFAEDYPYKVKDIEEDINDEDLLDDQERQEALKRWADLKENLRWEPSIEKTLKMLQKEGNYMANPEGLTVEEAERVAEELNKQASPSRSQICPMKKPK